VQLRLDHQSDDLLHLIERLADSIVPREQMDWNSGLLRLAPGHYLLTEANHPQWSCHITIKP
jgi:hypothetical protein